VERKRAQHYEIPRRDEKKSSRGFLGKYLIEEEYVFYCAAQIFNDKMFHITYMYLYIYILNILHFLLSGTQKKEGVHLRNTIKKKIGRTLWFYTFRD